MNVISHSRAKGCGFTRYFTGMPCRHGHVSERYVTSRACVVCVGNRKMQKRHGCDLESYRESLKRRKQTARQTARQMGMQILTRAEAKSKGLTQYFTGNPCKHGHISTRYVAGKCKECQKILQSNRFSRAREYARRKKRYREDPEFREKQKLRNAKRKGDPVYAERRRMRREADPVYREINIQRCRDYRVKNKDRIIEQQRLRGRNVRDLIEVLRKIEHPILREFGL